MPEPITGRCTSCHGSGVIDESPGPVTTCERCGGSGGVCHAGRDGDCSQHAIRWARLAAEAWEVE